MDAEIKEKWVAALRSGDYKQARDRLHVNGGHCCLGVLCEVLGLKRAQANGGESSYLFESSVFYTRLGGALCRKIKLDSDEQSRLVVLNDSDEKSFEEIADYISANL